MSFSRTENPHKMLRKKTKKGMRCMWSHASSPCLESTHQALLQCKFGISPCPYPDTWWQHGHTEQGRNDRHLRSDTLQRERKNVAQSCLLISCCQYLMVTEQDVLWGVKRRVCPNKSQTGHLWEMNKTRNAEACEAGEMTREGKLSAGCPGDKFRLWSAAAPYDRTPVSVFTSSTILWNSVRRMIWSNLIWD